jgi:hypothetical protein
MANDTTEPDTTPEVVVTEASVQAEERFVSEQTRLEMEVGRATLAATAASSVAERGE